MKRLLPILLPVLAGLWLATSPVAPRPQADDLDTRSFGRLPVLAGGRVKPLDTVARNSLLIMHGKQTLRLSDGQKMQPSRWLADVLFNATVADGYPVFAVHNQEILGLAGLPQADKRNCSFAELKPHLSAIEREGKIAADTDAAKRTPFQTAIHNLRNALILYQQLRSSAQPEDATSFAAEITSYATAVAAGAESLKSGAPPPSQDQLAQLKRSVARWEAQARNAGILMIPPPANGSAAEWRTTGAALIRVDSPQTIPVPVSAYAKLGDALRAGDRNAFSQIAADYLSWIRSQHPDWAGRSSFEWRFNLMQPFYHCMVLYVATFLLACLSWLAWPQELRQSAFRLLLLTIAMHSIGMFSRMYLQGRPPVTNLYSSAIFVGWGAVVLGAVLERAFRDGMGAACSGLVGFITLIIAHHLGSSGDTLEMMQAVLDSNIWLATHVVVITAGYSAMFLAGFLAIAYVLLGLLTPLLTKDLAGRLTRMVYGVICFATLFSFAGTVLGGIWADQSWGRFWGWDPKENGALLIVLWCALILHARWGGFIRQRGLMAMAVAGNAITAFSWFGVNMLGVGLHSYGFMDKAFPWLLGFVIVHGILVASTRLPARLWRSFRQASSPDQARAGFSAAAEA